MDKNIWFWFHALLIFGLGLAVLFYLAVRLG